MPKDESAISGETTPEELMSFADEVRGSRTAEQVTTPETDDLDKAPVLDEKPEQKETPAPQAKDAAKEQTVPPEKMYTLPDSELYGDLRGKKVTFKQLEESGLLDKMVTRDHQEMHNTKLYQDLQKKMEEEVANRVQQILRDSGVPIKDPNAPAPVDQKVFGDAVEGHYRPQLKALAQAGAFEEDALEAYPKMLCQIEHRFRSGAVALETLAQRITEVSEWVGMKKTEEISTQGQTMVESQIVAAANSDEKLGWLKEPANRKAFIDWAVSDDNPYPYKSMKVSQITPRIVTAAFLAYVNDNPDVIKPQAAPVATRKPNMASSGSGGTAPARSGGKTSEFEELIDGYKESIRARRSQLG